MLNIPTIDEAYLQNHLVELLNIPSPTGFTEMAVDYVERELGDLPGVVLSRTNKGGLVISIPGLNADKPRGLTAHIDTLGGMVKEIKPSGRLKLTNIGSFAWNTVEGEGCTIFTQSGDKVRGSLLLSKSSSHVHGKDVSETKRTAKVMEVRLDARTTSSDETESLGIQIGDFVSFDPRVEVTHGFVRSRHLDDKACVAVITTAVRALAAAGLQPSQDTTMLISNFEEVGHGAAAGLPDNLTELVAVDMAALGEGQASDEFHATICIKDSSGPYHHGLSNRLREIATKHEIPFKVDIYPYYGSDGGAYWRAGGNVAVALIGPGVDASHNYERTHMEALVATTQWVLAYLLSE